MNAEIHCHMRYDSCRRSSSRIGLACICSLTSKEPLAWQDSYAKALLHYGIVSAMNIATTVLTLRYTDSKPS